jgi:hypothetical protein
MKSKIFIPSLAGKNTQGGFLELIIIIVVALLVMNYFHLTVSGVLAYFGTSVSEIVDWVKSAFQNVVK